MALTFSQPALISGLKRLNLQNFKVPGELFLRISQRRKTAERELSHADKNTVITIANRLGSMGDHVKSAQAAFAK